MSYEELQFRYNELLKKEAHLKKKVIETLDCQQQYYSSRDKQVLRKSKAMESELRVLCNPPKPVQQQSFFNDEFLGR